MAYQKKIPAKIGVPIKIVDKTSTPQKIAKFKILNPQKIVRAPVHLLGAYSTRDP